MEERATDVDGPSRDEDGVVGTGSILTLVLTLLLTSHLPRMNHILGLVGPTVATMFAGEPLKWLIATVSFALAVLFVMVDVVGDAWSDRRRHLVRRTCLVGIVLSLVVLPLLFNVHVRHRSGDHRSQYDGLLQEEIAVAWVLNGQNPYAEDFGGTVVDSGRYDSVFRDLGYDRNPALAHYPYMPFNVVFALPFAILMDAAVGFYDHRIVLLISYCLLALYLPRLAPDGPRRRSLEALVLLNPLMVPWFFSGHNEVFVLCWLVLSLVLVRERRYVPAAIAAGLAISSKQLAWIYLPFFALAASGGRPGALDADRVRRALRSRAMVYLAVTVMVINAPFFLSDPWSFIDDTLLFHMGGSAEEYPLRGYYSYGIGSILLHLGIASLRGGFPLWLFHLAVTLPVALTLLKRQATRGNFRDMCTGFAITLLVGSFFMRSLHMNYLSLAVAICTIAAYAGDGSLPACVTSGHRRRRRR